VHKENSDRLAKCFD